MKKLIAVFLVAVIALTLAACANEQQNSDVSDNTQSGNPDSSSTQSLDPVPSADPGENDTAIFAATEGTWRLDGEEGTASIYMDGEGGFIAYYASGSVEASGYLGRCVDLIGEFEYRDLEIEEATLDSWPAYYLTWLEGENEDTRQWDALLVTTDLYTYIYAFDTKADYAEEMLDTWYEVLDGLTLDFPSE